MTSEKKDKKPAVTIFSTPTCGFCHMAMDYFDEKGVAYSNRDITTDEDGLNYVLNTVGQAATPVITIGNEVIVGFDREKIDSALQTLAS